MERHDGWATRLGVLGLLAMTAACGGGKSTPITPSPTTFTLQVQVRDEQQRGIANALVRVTDGLNAGRNATTDQSGLATLSNLSAGGLTLEVTASGYGQVNQGVTLTGSQTATVQMKLTPNTAPIITALVAKGTLPNEPANYVDATEVATVTVSVSDPETPAERMTFEWKSDVGTFTGTGASVKWQPPGNVGGSGPSSATLSVTVIEKYGPGDTLENKAASTVRVVLHDSKKESGEVSKLFLDEFSNSDIKAETVVRNFSGTLCPEGKTAELGQVADNRRDLKITFAAIGQPTAFVNFGGTCELGMPGDACVNMTCEWRSTRLATGVSEHVKGTCYLTTVYDRDRDAWKLCWSSFSGSLLPTGRRF
jgi:hypothetical protein